MKKRIKKWLVPALVIITLIFSVVILLRKPAHERAWEVGQEKLPRIDVSGDDVEISSFRDFTWEEDEKADGNYASEKYRLSELEKVDVVISHFSDFEGLAHIFLSFGFADGRHVVVSMETRREIGEEFSPTRGLMREFEIIYVVGSERDVIGLRTNVRDERVYVYPTIASPEKTRELFLKIAEDINGIYAKPKFYNTLLSNCTNVITRRVEELSNLDFPLTYKTIMPGFFDDVLYEMELIPNPAGKSFEEIKKCYLVDNDVVDYQDENFSRQIRQSCVE